MISDDTFEGTLKQARKPVLLFFTGSFCAPSVLIADLLSIDDPVLDSFEVIEVDVEKCPRSAMKMQIKGTPTLMIVNEAQPVTSRIGTQTENEFFIWLEAELKKL